MMECFLADVFVKSVVLLLGAWVLNLMMQRTSAAARHLVWVMAFVGVLCLPVLSLIVPEFPVPVLPSAFSPAVTEALPESDGAKPVAGVAESQKPLGFPSAIKGEGEDPGAADVSAPVSPAPIPDKTVTGRSAPVSERWWLHGLLFIWIAGVCVNLGFTFAGLFRLRRLAARARQVNGGRIIDVLSTVCRETRFAPRAVILESDEAMIPMTWGIRRPYILLPAAANEWPVERLRAVLLHEMAHVRRWDFATQLVAQLARAVYWLNPVAWIGIRRLRVERERACDDFVLRCGVGASEYAESLVRIVGGLRPVPAISAAAVTMARMSGIEGRVRGILSEKVRRGGVRTEIAVLFVLLAAIAGSFLSAIEFTDETPATSRETDGTGKRILAARWAAALDEPVAKKIRSIGMPVETASENLEAFLCPSEDLMALVRRELAGGFVAILPELGWLRPENRERSDHWRQSKRSPVPGREKQGWWRVELSGAVQYQYELGAEGAKVELESTGIPVVLDGVPPDGFEVEKARWVGLIKHKEELLPGQTLIMLGEIGEALGRKFFVGLAWQASAWPDEQAAFVQSVGDAEQWILEGREGIEKMAAGASAWVAKGRDQAAETNDPWTIALPGGESIRLVAIGRPMDNPMIWWDPDGYPIVPNPRWGQVTPTEEIALVIDSSQHAGTAFRGWAEGTPGLPVHGAFSGSGVGTVLKIGKGSWERASKEGRDLGLTLGYEVGEWKEISQIDPEEKVEIDGAVYSLDEAKMRPPPWAAPGVPSRGPTYVHVEMRYTFDPDVAVGVGVVDQDGEIKPLHTQMVYINRSEGGDEARYVGDQLIGTLLEIDHLVLLNRPRKWSTLKGFALEPKVDEMKESAPEGAGDPAESVSD